MNRLPLTQLVVTKINSVGQLNELDLTALSAKSTRTPSEIA